MKFGWPARFLLASSATLTSFAVIALPAQRPGERFDLPAPRLTAPVPSTTTTPPTTLAPTTTAPPPPPPTAAPRPAVARPVVTSTPATAAPPPPTAPVVGHSGRTESCGWMWDAIHNDNGMYDAVTITLDAPRRPNQAVTVLVVPAGPTTPPASIVTHTDAAGQASVTARLSADKRDWTLTISAAFAPGTPSCAARTFTITY